jgi:LPS export ABC transporter protein LptC
VINREKKLRLIQFSLLLIGITIIFFTYLYNNQSTPKKNSLEILKEKSEEKISSDISNVFYNIEYAGFDLSGNRYVIKSKKASTNLNNDSEIFMDGVSAIFYFKNDTSLIINSNFGIYNNETLDMKFSENIKGNYDKSILNADYAEYSNSEGLVTISNNVKIIDYRGNLNADKLLFDLKTQTLNISSNNEKSINAKIKN